jgi:hypothetical protein
MTVPEIRYNEPQIVIFFFLFSSSFAENTDHREIFNTQRE